MKNIYSNEREVVKYLHSSETIQNMVNQYKEPLFKMYTAISGVILNSEHGLDNRTLSKSTLKIINENMDYLINITEYFEKYLNHKFEREKFNLTNTIKYAINLLNVFIKKNNLVLYTEFGKDCKIDGIEEEFIQVLLNIFVYLTKRVIKNEEKVVFIKTINSEKLVEIYIWNKNKEEISSLNNKHCDCFSSNINLNMALNVSKRIIEKHFSGKFQINSCNCNTNENLNFRIILNK